MIPEHIIDAAVHARGRLHNPKWDDPIMGYETFDEAQKEFLREIASAMLTAAHEASIVRTVEELDALPPRTAIRDADGYLMERGDGTGWYSAGSASKFLASDIAFPARVLSYGTA